MKKIRYFIDIFLAYKYWELIFLNRFFGRNTRICVLRNGIKIFGGYNSNIPDLVYEIFIKSFYFYEKLQIYKNDVVMDIGANIGVFSIFAAKKGASKIYSIEPIYSNCELIRKNFKVNKFALPIIINRAVVNKIGTTKFYLGNLDSHGTVSDHNHKGKFTDAIKVKTTTLEHIFEKQKIRKIDFLKIDCEGSEGEIVKSTKKSIWDRINKISMEYHDDASSLSHKQIGRVLRKMKFKVKIKPTGKFFGYIYAWK